MTTVTRAPINVDGLLLCGLGHKIRITNSDTAHYDTRKRAVKIKRELKVTFTPSVFILLILTLLFKFEI